MAEGVLRPLKALLILRKSARSGHFCLQFVSPGKQTVERWNFLHVRAPGSLSRKTCGKQVLRSVTYLSSGSVKAKINPFRLSFSQARYRLSSAAPGCSVLENVVRAELYQLQLAATGSVELSSSDRPEHLYTIYNRSSTTSPAARLTASSKSFSLGRT
jgi:hypothetical protein